MAKQRFGPNNVSTNEILHLLDQDISRGKVVALDTEYLAKLNDLVKDVTTALQLDLIRPLNPSHFQTRLLCRGDC